MSQEHDGSLFLNHFSCVVLGELLAVTEMLTDLKSGSYFACLSYL